MNKITSTLLAIALAGSALWAADPPGEKPKEKSPAEVLYEKLLAENTKEADKQYGEYLAALAKANESIIKKLEIAKADLNNPKKGNLSITERAAAIAEIDAKILEVKKNGVGEAVVAKAGSSSDLLGENLSKPQKSIVGVWTLKRHDGVQEFTFGNDGSFSHSADLGDGNWTIDANGLITITYKNGSQQFKMSDGNIVGVTHTAIKLERKK